MSGIAVVVTCHASYLDWLPEALRLDPDSDRARFYHALALEQHGEHEDGVSASATRL